jgi:hypothetical protein
VTKPNAHRYLQTISEVNLSIKQRFDREGWTHGVPLHLALRREAHRRGGARRAAAS